MFAHLIRSLLFLLSWASLLFYPKSSLRRFLPVTLFVTGLVFILLSLSNPLRLWRVPGRTGSKIFNDLAFTLGPFIAANLWVFRLVYGHLWKYLGLNLILDFLMSYPVSAFFKKIKIYELKRFKPPYFFATIYSFAILAYAFQYFIKESSQ